MVRITNGSRVTVVTRGVFEEVYKPSGWEICDISNENIPNEDLPEVADISAEETVEMPDSETPATEDVPEEITDEEEDFEIPISEMKLSELKAYAAEHNIDISAAKTKQDIRAIIKAEMEA